MLKDKRVIITILICITFLFAGWSAGSALGYKNGFVAGQKQQSELNIKKDISEDSKRLLSKVQRIRDDLMIRYRGNLSRDFLTILAAHQKGSGKLCDEFISLSDDDKVKDFCANKIIPFATDTRNEIHSFLIEAGMK